ncbi:psaL [Symbiodinium natans]|uniref:PSI subunit V n=1 Tax=Symbiodinium natans TaxID=878477 RepID=A0A812HIV2_9DINO|nr:psaL [Symbiodinium natans]
MRDFLNVSTALTVAVLGVATLLLSEQPAAFTAGVHGVQAQAPARGRTSTVKGPTFASAHEALGTQGILCFGMGFGALVAVGRGLAARRAEGSDIAVKEKSDIASIGYLKDIPRTIVEMDTLELILKNTPRDQWENPPEDSDLYMVKAYAEMYGPGKATKMGWWDYLRLKNEIPDSTQLTTERELQEIEEWKQLQMEGKIPFAVPGPSGYFLTGFVTQWKGKEPFAGDQVITLTENGLFAKQFLSNMAFYREGLKPWQRGLEIGMAHGYFLIGPFTSLGPLRNTPEAATVGLLCGCAIVGIVSIGGLLFGSTIKPTRFDKEGDKPAAGFIEMINWHAIGGLGGAGFAHALITDGAAVTAAISACAEVGQWQRASGLHAHGAGLGDLATFGATLAAASVSWPRALVVQEALQDAGLQGNTITQNSLAQAYQLGAQWQRALLQEHWATEGDPLSYSTLFQDFARAFRVQIEDLGPGSEQNVSVVLELLKNGGIFHELFYPALPEDDGEADGESLPDEAPTGDPEV